MPISKDRALDKIQQLAAGQQDLVSFWNAASNVLAEAVPHYTAPCW